MSNVTARALEQAIKLLKAANCEFIIQTPDGKCIKEGNFWNTPVKSKRVSGEFPFGEIRNYVREHIKDLGVNEQADIPVSKYGFVKIQAGASSLAHEQYGSGNYLTALNRKKKIVEVLRMA